MVLDEPTKAIDVGARANIYEIIHSLAARGKGVLVVSSEAEELLVAVPPDPGHAQRPDRRRFSTRGYDPTDGNLTVPPLPHQRLTSPSPEL